MFEWMAWTPAGGGVLQLHRADARRHDGVGAALADRRCARACCRSRRRAATGSSSACSPPPTSTSASSAVSEKMVDWFGLEQEPSIWISFVVSMARAGAGHAQGLSHCSRKGIPARFFPAGASTLTNGEAHRGDRDEDCACMRWPSPRPRWRSAKAPGPARPRPRNGSTASSSRRRCRRTSRRPR